MADRIFDTKKDKDLIDLLALFFENNKNIIASCSHGVTCIVLCLNASFHTVTRPHAFGNPSGHVYISVTSKGSFHFNVWERPPALGYISEKLNISDQESKIIRKILNKLNDRVNGIV